MADTLERFCTDCRSTLRSAAPLSETLPVMAEGLAQLLANPNFIAETFSPQDDFSKKDLFHDAETDFRVLAHVHQGPKAGLPHSHGASWAIYGAAMGVTGMKEWQRVNPASEESAVLRMSAHYELRQGETRGYGPHVIHSTIHSGKAWVIRVTGADLDLLPRYRFDRKRDRIAETV